LQQFTRRDQDRLRQALEPRRYRHPHARLWVMDETTLPLLPPLRVAWAPEDRPASIWWTTSSRELKRDMAANHQFATTQDARRHVQAWGASALTVRDFPQGCPALAHLLTR
jgi:hypothetical protein